MRVRRATAADADLLALVGAATFLEAFIDEIPGRAIAAHCARHHAAQSYRGHFEADSRAAAWIAEHDTTAAPVGYALLTTPDATVRPQPGDIELKRIYVFSRFHATGLAQRLMDAAIAHAGETGAPRLLLGTYGGNHRAIGFYRRNGFLQTGKRQFRVGAEVFDDIIMARTVS